MGHEQASTTLDTYGHLLPDGGTAAAQAMARIFGGTNLVLKLGT